MVRSQVGTSILEDRVEGEDGGAPDEDLDRLLLALPKCVATPPTFQFVLIYLTDTTGMCPNNIGVIGIEFILIDEVESRDYDRHYHG
jgi:hypothetical protein